MAPIKKRIGKVKRIDRYGSTRNAEKNQNVTYIPRTMKFPWAKLMIFITPKIKFNEIAIRAYIPPVIRPFINAGMTRLKFTYFPSFNLNETGNIHDLEIFSHL